MSAPKAPRPAGTQAPLPAYFYDGDTLCADCAADVRSGDPYAIPRYRDVKPGMFECAYCNGVIGSALARVAESESGGTTGGGA